jgi:hypothetical protein
VSPLRRLPVAIAFLALLAVPVVTQGKPSSKTPPSTKNTPPPATAATVVTKAPKLATKHIAVVKQKKPMTIEAKTQVLAASGIKADAGDLGEPVTISVRDPSEKHATLSFTGLNMVLANQGVAVIGQLSDMNEFDGPAHTESDEAVEGPFICSASMLGLTALCESLRLAAQAGSQTTPTVSGGYVTLRFRAAPDTGYIVDCLASGDTDLHALVIVDKAVVDREDAAANGRFDLYVHRGARRDVRIDLIGEQPWTLRQCQLTPVRS